MKALFAIKDFYFVENPTGFENLSGLIINYLWNK